MNMEIPLCVIDAKTLVDHIQDIKHWIYGGHLRLVVPSSAIENVEQHYQKAIEPKPTAQDGPRPRSSGKPARREYPAFDINPRVAREYLARLKAWKEGEATSEQRDFFHEKENHGAVEFQQLAEQYTPWKDLDVEEEKPESVEGPPTTWAEALRRKQNLANGISGQPQVPKGPAKPKLVARVAGSETSPWKMKKDAPNISAKDVPGTLRPLMSCALWRLHESIDRNDANRLFLLSDQTEIRSVAQKLNILVRSAKELAATIKSGVAKTDLGVFGDVEREFGIQTNEKDHLAMNAALKNGERTGAHDTSDVIRDQHDVMDGSISSAGTAKTGGSSILTDEHQEQHSPSQPNGKAQLNDFDQNKETPIHEIHEYSRAQEADNLVDLAPSSVPENILEDTTQNTIKVTDDVSLEDPAKSLSKCIDSFMLNCTRTQSDIPGQQDREVLAKSTPPANLVHEPRFSDDAQSPQKTGIINFATSPHNSESAVQTPLKSQALQDAEDSDEEVVVFKPQPKRFSAQKKSAPEKIRPLTPATQPQKEIARQNPTSSASASQSQQAIEQGNKRMSTLVNELQQQPVAESPTLLANGKHPRAKIKGHSPRLLNIGHAHPQPTGSLTVIDPDAFGRSFAVNTNSNSRPLQYANGHSNQRLRQNTRDPQMGQARRQDGLRNMSHPRHSRENSRQLPVAGASGIDGSPSSHSQRAPRTSSMRRPNALQPESAPSSDHTHVPAIQSTSKFPEVTEPTELLPRTKLSGTPSEPEVPPPPPRVFDSAEFVPRPHKPEPQLKFRPPKQRFIEPTEFVSRDFVPRTSSQARFKEQTPEPEYIERKASIPDVDYVLKSGSTRASARGRGRLWTPS